MSFKSHELPWYQESPAVSCSLSYAHTSRLFRAAVYEAQQVSNSSVIDIELMRSLEARGLKADNLGRSRCWSLFLVKFESVPHGGVRHWTSGKRVLLMVLRGSEGYLHHLRLALEEINDCPGKGLPLHIISEESLPRPDGCTSPFLPMRPWFQDMIYQLSGDPIITDPLDLSVDQAMLLLKASTDKDRFETDPTLNLS